MRNFNKNEHYRPSQGWNDEEKGVGGKFGENRFSHCKLYRYDGTIEPLSEDDYRGKRGLLVRDHYSENDVVKVHIICDNLCEFLTQEGIEHTRINYDKETRKPID